MTRKFITWSVVIGLFCSLVGSGIILAIQIFWANDSPAHEITVNAPKNQSSTTSTIVYGDQTIISGNSNAIIVTGNNNSVGNIVQTSQATDYCYHWQYIGDNWWRCREHGAYWCGRENLLYHYCPGSGLWIADRCES